MAVVHCKGHQKGSDPVAEGNRHTDAATKEASWGQLPDKPKVLLALKISIAPRYSPEEEKWIKKERGTKAKTEWWVTQDHKVYVPEQPAYKLVHQQHKLTHMGKTTLETLQGGYYLIAASPHSVLLSPSDVQPVYNTKLTRGLVGQQGPNIVDYPHLRIWKWTSLKSL